MKFQAKIKYFDENNLGHGPYIEIPEAIYQELLKITTDKRVKCTLNNEITVSRAMAPKGNFHYILLNKEVLKEAKISVGDLRQQVVIISFSFTVCYPIALTRWPRPFITGHMRSCQAGPTLQPYFLERVIWRRGASR